MRQKYRTALAWRPHYFVAGCQATPYSNSQQQWFILLVNYSTANLYLLRYLLVWQHLLMLRIPAAFANSEHYTGNSQVLRTETLFWQKWPSLPLISPKIHLRRVVLRKFPQLSSQLANAEFSVFLQHVFIKHPSLQHLIPVWLVSCVRWLLKRKGSRA